MPETYWNGRFDTRWEDAPLGLEAIRLVQWVREHGHAEGARREFAHAVVHMGRVLHEAKGEITAQGSRSEMRSLLEGTLSLRDW